MTTTQAFESSLSRGGDSCVVRSKQLLQPTVGTTPTLILNINPAGLGGRQTAIGAVFSDFRVKNVLVRFIGSTTATSIPETVAVGFLDDSSGAEGDAPTNANDILELRCSGVSLGATTVPTEIVYRPVNSQLWYKTFAGASGSDPRLTTPAVLYAASAAAGAASIEVDVTIVYKGAVDLADTVMVERRELPTPPSGEVPPSLTRKLTVAPMLRR